MAPQTLSRIPRMPEIDDEDEELTEDQKKQMEMFEKIFGGTEFDRKLDSFIDSQLKAGVDYETIMKNAMNGSMPGMDGQTPFDSTKTEMEFDPSKFKLDPEVMEAFKGLMNERQGDADMAKFFNQMMNDPEKMEEMVHSVKGEEAQEPHIIDVDPEEEEDLAALKRSTASERIESGYTQTSKEEVKESSKAIFAHMPKKRKE